MTGQNWFAKAGWRHLVAIGACLFALFPILFVISAAFNPLGTLSSTTLIPTVFSTSNFENLFRNTDFPRWFFNSVLISGCATVLAVMLSTFAAYAFSRFRFAGRRPGLLFLLIIQMFPAFLAIVTIYLIFTQVTELYPIIGFNTPWSLVLLYMGGALGVNTWLIKGFFDTVPKELDESAKVDGASHSKVFRSVILPLVTPVLAVTGVLAFIGSINEFIIASVFLTQSETKTLAVGLFGMIAGERNANFGMFAAGTLLTAIPTVLLFYSLQKYIVGGLTSGAVKGSIHLRGRSSDGRPPAIHREHASMSGEAAASTRPETPAWVRDAVFYQIFPDRFARSARIVPPGPLEPWDAPPTAHGFKGGDLLGVAEHLDHLQALGITAVYLNPVLQSASNHRYHTYDYFRVDPLLGGDAALRELIDACHARGMRVVLDGVFNHASRGFWPFNHVLETGRHSPYVDWFYFHADDLATERPIRAYPWSGDAGPRSGQRGAAGRGDRLGPGLPGVVGPARVAQAEHVEPARARVPALGSGALDPVRD